MRLALIGLLLAVGLHGQQSNTGGPVTVNVYDYGAKCNATPDGTTGTDDLPAIQAALDANPQATIEFPSGAVCKLSDTLLLSSKTPLRRFSGVLDGNGATLVWTNNGSSSSTDANMPVGIGAYNRFADPGLPASELGGVIYVEIKNFNMNCPDYGVCIFLGNSQQNWIHDNQLGRSLNTTAWPPVNFTQKCRHGIVLDGDFNDMIEHNFFACGRMSGLGIIASGASPVRVTYTDGALGCTGCSGYFNDYPHIVRNQFGNAGGVAAILDNGTGSFSSREIRENYAGPQGWFYLTANGIHAEMHDNDVEGGFATAGSFNIFGNINAAGGGNVPMPAGYTGLTLPRSYFACPNSFGCGGFESANIHDNEFSGPNLIFYAETCCVGGNTGHFYIKHNRFNNPSASATWVTTTSGFFGTVYFSQDNYGFGSIAISNVFYPTAINIEPVRPYTCYTNTFAITGGGNWFENGVDTGVPAGPGNFQFLYFNDPLPPGSIVTGVGIRTTTAFTAAGLTSFRTNGVGDGAGLGVPPAVDTWYSAASYDLLTAPSKLNHAEYVVWKAPQDYTNGQPYVNLVANQALNVGGLTGAFRIQICYLVPPEPIPPYIP